MRVRLEQSAAGTVSEHCGDSIVLQFAEVDLSCWSSFDRLVGGFVQVLWGLVHIVAVGNTIEELDRSE